MKRNFFLKSFLSFIFGAYFFYYSLEIYLFFFTLSFFYLLAGINKKSNNIDDVKNVDTNPLDVLGNYQLENDKNDFSYGLFTKILDDIVFFEIKKDELIKERIEYLENVLKDKNIIESKILKFKNKNLNFKDKKLKFIASHNKKITRLEMFWEPDGYTIINDGEIQD